MNVYKNLLLFWPCKHLALQTFVVESKIYIIEITNGVFSRENQVPQTGGK